jgi:hypothetical protein
MPGSNQSDDDLDAEVEAQKNAAIEAWIERQNLRELAKRPEIQEAIRAAVARGRAGPSRAWLERQKSASTTAGADPC